MTRDLCEIHIITSGPDAHNHSYPTCRTWSRDGRYVFVESVGSDGSGLLKCDVETGGSERLVDAAKEGAGGCYSFDYSSGANCIVHITADGHHLRLLNVETLRGGMVWNEPEGVICGPPAISHDGTRIAYWAMMPSVESRWFDSYVTVIFALDVDPVECRLVRSPWVVEAYPRRKGKTFDRNPGDGVHVNHPQINPVNRDHICYSHEMHGTTPDGSVAMCRLWQVMADGDQNRYLVRQKAGLHFTHEVIAPDGRSLIFPYMHGVGQVDFETFEKRSLYYNPDCCPGHLTVSPDMRWIAGDTWGDWVNDKGERVQSVMMFNVESRRYAHLCWIPRSKGHPGHPHPNFSPGGRRIAFSCLVDGRCQVAYIDVGEVTANWDAMAEGVGEVSSPEW